MLLSWIGRVWPNEQWDYKRKRRGTEMMGTFNFGATGGIFFDLKTLRSGAGIVQLFTLPSLSDGVPFVSLTMGIHLSIYSH